MYTWYTHLNNPRQLHLIHAPRFLLPGRTAARNMNLRQAPVMIARHTLQVDTASTPQISRSTSLCAFTTLWYAHLKSNQLKPNHAIRIYTHIIKIQLIQSTREAFSWYAYSKVIHVLVIRNWPFDFGLVGFLCSDMCQKFGRFQYDGVRAKHTEHKRLHNFVRHFSWGRPAVIARPNHDVLVKRRHASGITQGEIHPTRPTCSTNVAP